jgi:pilus assembly protein TadC
MTEQQAESSLTSDESKEIFRLMVEMRGSPMATNEFLARVAEAITQKKQKENSSTW